MAAVARESPEALEWAPDRPGAPSPMAAIRVSIVIPTLDEADHIEGALRRLEAARRAGHEVIVVDGGSSDGTAAIARRGDKLITCPAGRARQMNAGAAAATGEVLLFLHADTELPGDGLEAVGRGLADTGAVWGRFDVRLSGRQPLLRVVERLIGWRSRLTGIATGDQAIFATRAAFARAGGYPDQPLLEDVALSVALKRGGRPLCLRQRVTTSSRRWEEHGTVRTILLMWWIRAAYALGVAPARLARIYRGG